MRIALLAASVALALSAPRACLADPIGPPFLIGSVIGGSITSEGFETRAGDVAVISAANVASDGYAEAIHSQIFGERGPKDGRALVFRSDGSAALPAGAISLAEGATLVGYVVGRGSAPRTLYARIVYDGGVAGGEFDLRGGALDSTGGFLLPLATRGLVVVTRFNDSKRLTGLGSVRLVRSSGKVGPVRAEISRKSHQIASASRYRDGFIVRYVNPDRNFLRSVRAQIYGPVGGEVGQEKILEPAPGSPDARFTQVLGLTDGSIAVLRRTTAGVDDEVSAELFHDDWSLKRARTVLARIAQDKGFAAASLPAGGFVIGLEQQNRAGLNVGFDVRRFDAASEPAGDPLRVRVEGGASALNLIGRTKGDVFVSYSSFQFGQTVRYGRFIEP